MKSFRSLLLLLLLPLAVHAQRGVEGGFLLGGSTYYGDLAETFIGFQEVNLVYGVNLRFNFTRNLSLRIAASQTKLTGDDANNPTLFVRDFRFTADLFETAILGEIHILGKEGYNIQGKINRKIVPYLFTGIAFTLADAQVDASNSEPKFIREPFPEENDKADFISLPFGAGIRYIGANSYSIGLEAGMRAVFSDYLDGISINGRPDRNDWYLFVGVTGSYLFYKASPCKFF